MPTIQTESPSSPSTAPTVSQPKPTSILTSSEASSSSPYVRPPGGAPYMVALSGWPEPVYIAGSGPPRSRPTTPRRSTTGEFHEGIPPAAMQKHWGSSDVNTSIIAGNVETPSTTTAGPNPPGQSIFSRPCMYVSDSNEICVIPDHPNHTAKYHLPSKSSTNHSADSPSPFPTSSARGTPHPSPPPSSRSSPQIHHAAQIHYPSMYPSNPRRKGYFKDPRFAPHVAVLKNRPALPIAPNWSSSSSSPQSNDSPVPTGVGVKVVAGQRGTGFLVMRAVPDVYPPPVFAPGMAGIAAGMARSTSGTTGATRGGLGVATEVYPRDPDSAFLWGSAAGVPNPSRAGSVSTSIGGDESKMEVDEKS